MSVAVAENLHFDVPRAAHEALQEDRVVTERRRGFLAGLCEANCEIAGLLDHTHAASAAAEGCFDD